MSDSGAWSIVGAFVSAFIMDDFVANPKTLAHLSDLHLGRSKAWHAKAQALRDFLRAQSFDHILITGDITDHGAWSEYEQFKRLFGEFIEAGQLTVIPGNHDRMTDDRIAYDLLQGQPVQAIQRPGLTLICVDTTGSHNRYVLAGHGKIKPEAVHKVDTLVTQAPDTDLVIVAMHHHLLPMRGDLWIERVLNWLELPTAKEVRLGRMLIDQLKKGSCDLILHGHRHIPKEMYFTDEGSALQMYNGGSSTELQRFRVFTHQDGTLIQPPTWMNVE